MLSFWSREKKKNGFRFFEVDGALHLHPKKKQRKFSIQFSFSSLTPVTCISWVIFAWEYKIGSPNSFCAHPFWKEL